MCLENTSYLTVNNRKETGKNDIHERLWMSSHKCLFISLPLLNFVGQWVQLQHKYINITRTACQNQYWPKGTQRCDLELPKYTLITNTSGRMFCGQQSKSGKLWKELKSKHYTDHQNDGSSVMVYYWWSDGSCCHQWWHDHLLGLVFHIGQSCCIFSPPSLNNLN